MINTIMLNEFRFQDNDKYSVCSHSLSACKWYNISSL